MASQLKMLLCTQLVALALVYVEIDGAAQFQNYQPAGVKSFRWGQAARSLDEKGGKLNQMTYRPVGDGYNHITVGADGAAQVAFRLDLSVLMNKLNMIPELLQILGVLGQKVDALYNNSRGQGYERQIIALEQYIAARLDRQDASTNALHQMIQQLEAELGSISQALNEIFKIVQSLASGGGTCGPQIADMGRQLERMMKILTQVFQMVERLGANPTPGLSAPILEYVQQNNQMLQKIIIMLEKIGAGMGGSPGFPQPIAPGPEAPFAQWMTSVITLVETIPLQVVKILQSSGVLEGLNRALIQFLKQLMPLCESILAEVIALRNALNGAIEELRKYFAENQRSLVAVKKVVTETTELVQSSAAAAISASRSLKCPSKSRADIAD